MSICAFFRPATNLLYVSPRPRLAALMRDHLSGGGIVVAAAHGGIGLERTQELRLGGAA